MMIGVRKKIPACVGMKSCIAIRDSFPVSWGNYFCFYDPSDSDRLRSSMSIRCLNFWAENLEEAKVRFLHDNQVEVIFYPYNSKHKDEVATGWAIVDDSRIPKEWYYNKICTTGCHAPSVEVMQEIFTYLGDPTNELEQFTDPKSYWKKRGGDWNNGVICFKYNKSNTLTNG